MMLGAYAAWTLGTEFGLNDHPFVAMLGAVALLVAIGSLIEVALLRPFYGKKNLVMLTVITTLACLIFIQNAALIGWGPRTKQLPLLLPGETSLLGVVISAQEALIIVAAPLIVFCLWLWLRFTRSGRAIRAVSQNHETAQLLGMNVSALYMIAFAVSAGLAAVAGVLLGSIRFLSPDMGSEPLVKALIVTIFGGLGSILGTVGGAYAIGLLEAFSTYFVGLYWTPVILFAVMILTLMVRPRGLFSR
jgi:branched-chain amino acid transport system permease protein